MKVEHGILKFYLTPNPDQSSNHPEIITSIIHNEDGKFVIHPDRDIALEELKYCGIERLERSWIARWAFLERSKDERWKKSLKDRWDYIV